MSFLSELKRRRVVRVAIGYAVAAVAVISAASDILPALNLPPSAVTLVVVLTLLGFPIAVALAWAFDWNDEGVVRTRGESGDAPRQGRSRLAMGAVIGAAALVAMGGWYLYRAAAPDAETIDSIAVLPFVDLSADKSQEYFSDGMAEELLNALARVPDLQVASRSASFRYRGSGVDPREVGRELGVAAVLEGSVRREGNSVRIAAQLVNVETGFEFWSESYTRQLTSIFAVQEAVSREIVEALHMRLPRATSDGMVKPGTTNLRAYDLYLQGRHQFHSTREVSSPEEAKALLLGSIETYHQALALDSTYALPWSGIADSYVLLADDFWSPHNANPKAKAAARRALALDPELAQAHASLAAVMGQYDWDFAGMDREFRRALELDSTVAEVHARYSVTLALYRRCEEAGEYAGSAARLDARIGGDTRMFVRVWCGQRDQIVDSLRSVRKDKRRSKGGGRGPAAGRGRR